MLDWQKKDAVFDGAVVGIFFLVIFLPALLAFVPWGKANPQLTEKRRLSERPAIPVNTEELIGYPRQFDKYFDDHFPFRSRLIQGNNYLSIKLLKKSDQHHVLMGREGWLFYTREKLLQDFCGQVPFTEEKLEGFRRMVEAKRNWLAARGIAYIFVIPPNKQTVYAEYMPENFSRVRGRTRMDQVMAYMQAHSDVTIVDLRPILIAAKSRHRIYFRHDTHWNDIGALNGYGEIMRAAGHALGRDVGIIRTLEDYTVSPKERLGGDLTEMLGLSAYFKEDNFILSPRWAGGTCAEKQELSSYPQSTWEFRNPPFAMMCPMAENTMVMFRDSFGNKLVQFLSENFRRSVFFQKWNYEATFFKAVVENEQPDIVIDECGERMLYYLETGPMHRP
jgi:hypothetical protein